LTINRLKEKQKAGRKFKPAFDGKDWKI